MPDVTNSQVTPARPAAKRLIQAAALAAMLVPLGSVTAHANTLQATCTPDGSGGCTVTFPFTFFGSGDTVLESYKIGFDFYGVTQEFILTVDDNVPVIEGSPPTQAEFDTMVDPSLAPFDSYDCVPLVTPSAGDSGCRRFTFTTNTETEPWVGYTEFFSWLYDSENSGFSNGDGSLGNIRILQAPGDSTTFTVDMCLAALAEVPNYVTCVYEASTIDPTVKSGDTRFSDQMVALAKPVPEPASIALLGTGLAGLLYRRRRNLKG